MDEIREILDEIRENQRRQEKEMAEMKKTLIEQNKKISIRTESSEDVLGTLVPSVQHLTNRLQEVLDSNFGEDLSVKIAETRKELRTRVDAHQSALGSFAIGQNKLFEKFEGLKKELSDTREELSNAMTRSTETIRISTVQTKRQLEEIAKRIDQIKVDDILSAVRVVHSKVDNVQSSVEGIETTQNEVQRKVVENGKIQEEMRPVIEKIGKEQLKKEEAEEKKKKAQRLQAIQKEYNETVLPLLTGPLAHKKQKIYLNDGEIQISNGKKMSLNEFKEGIKNNIWSIFPEDYGHILWAVEGITGVNGKITTYNGINLTVSNFIIGVETKPFDYLNPEDYEVECCDCKKQVSISSCLREDKISVRCSCNGLTLLGNPKPGFQWVYFSNCQHCQKVPSDETPTNCTFCGKQARCLMGCNGDARIPTRKP